MNNRRVRDFMRGADLVVHDAQYINTEYYSSKLGWGHTPVEYVLWSTLKAGVKRVALFHHDPTRSDEELGKIERLARDRVARLNHHRMEVFAAREGMVVEL
ncbi:MAG: hypothetical protein ACOC8N_07420 [Spirochaetota bacterium]